MTRIFYILGFLMACTIGSYSNGNSDIKTKKQQTQTIEANDNQSKVNNNDGI